MRPEDVHVHDLRDFLCSRGAGAFGTDRRLALTRRAGSGTGCAPSARPSRFSAGDDLPPRLAALTSHTRRTDIETLHRRPTSPVRPSGSSSDVALAALDFLSGVIASNATAFRGFHALTVDHPGAQAGLLPFQVPRRHDEVMVDAFQKAVRSPVVEIALHRRGRWKIVWRHRTLATRRGHVHDHVHDIAQLRRPRPTNLLARRHERRKQRLLPVRQIACITLATALIIPARDFGPHVVPPRLLQHKRGSHKQLKSLN